ncbi:MAG: outer membrane biogenesis protein BamB [Candidatus Hydrogenedentes bacterium ADurb.Bin179]|nr:MAG: outer membrane biogenesis protein BamB [Candidatus Hydrogenedentes bacterium ADurb.Bin179]
MPEEPSPIVLDGLLYIVSNDGIVTCLEAETGAKVWSERIGGNYMASPIYADGRLYFCSTQGRTTVLKAGRSFEKLAVNELDDGCLASPAIDGKALFIRTKTHLYRIEN